ncbi:hypothetical protein L1987_20407 [Smallanthus sonchifolius]|uniref:Uncharacterized protein n=1 Tax=Smallanthus sonchifolius TaxID=185202 RepID=A0ACB9ITT6_9ASTR|nr:hypothetical protein L1987_20407 [Smallanthus sonchifolius]
MKRRRRRKRKKKRKRKDEEEEEEEEERRGGGGRRKKSKKKEEEEEEEEPRLGARRGWDVKENDESLILRSDTPGLDKEREDPRGAEHANHQRGGEEGIGGRRRTPA